MRGSVLVIDPLAPLRVALRVLVVAAEQATAVAAALESTFSADDGASSRAAATKGHPEGALSDVDASLHALLARVTEGLLVTNESNCITFVSEGLTGMLGDRADLIGRNVIDLVHPDDAPAIRAALATVVARSEGAISFELRAEHVSGPWRWLEVRAVNLLAEPSVRGVAMHVRDVSERKALEDDLRHQALHDTLTGLPNRSLLMDRLRGAIDRCGRDSRTVAVFFLDLDSFKSINDTLGHGAGDAVLADVGRRLSSVARAQDTVARYGGDEFVVIVEHDQGAEWVKDFAERLRSVFREPVKAGGQLVPVSASFGVATATGGRPSPEGLLRDADAAMYHAKQSDGDGCAIFEDSMIDSQFVDLTVE